MSLSVASARITDVRSRVVAVDAAPAAGLDTPPAWEYLLSTILTDQEIVGYTMMPGTHREGLGLGYLLRDVFRERLIGSDALSIEVRWQELRDLTRVVYPISESLLAHVDVALWDILGKAAGLPIAHLLGLYRTEVPSYMSATWSGAITNEQVASEALGAKSRGFRGYKLWTLLGPEGDIPRLHAARAAVGPDFALMADAGGRYTYSEATQVGRALDELGYQWFEEPIQDQYLGRLRRLTEKIRTPVLAAEKGTPLGFTPAFIASRSVDALRGDVLMKGGISGLRKLAALTELHGMNVEVHGTLTPLMDIANLHVSCAIANTTYAEVFGDPYYRFGLVGTPLEPDEDGLMHLPTKPGLGVELDWDWIDNHTIVAIPSR